MTKTSFIIILCLVSHFMGYVFGRQDKSMAEMAQCQQEIDLVQDMAADACNERIDEILGQF